MEKDTTKHVVVTGAGRGIGAAIASHLAARGCFVHACARESAPSDDRVHLSNVDIQDRNAVAHWAATVRERTDTIDALINNAAVLGERTGFSDVSADSWHLILQTNILGTIWVTRAFLPLLKENPGTTIINIGSVLGRFGRAGWSPYSVSKFALEGLTEVLAQELAGHGVRVLTIHPSRVGTRLRREAYGEDETVPEQNLRHLLDAVTWLLESPEVPLSGHAFSVSDLPYWGGGP